MSNKAVCEALLRGVASMEERKRRVGRVRVPSVGDSILSFGQLYDIVEIYPGDKIGVDQTLLDRYSCTLIGTSKVYSFLFGNSSLRLAGSLCLDSSSRPFNVWTT